MTLVEVIKACFLPSLKCQWCPASPPTSTPLTSHVSKKALGFYSYVLFPFHLITVQYCQHSSDMTRPCLLIHCQSQHGLAIFSDHFGLKTNTTQVRLLARLRHRVGLCTWNSWHAWHAKLSITSWAVTHRLWKILKCSECFEYLKWHWNETKSKVNQLWCHPQVSRLLMWSLGFGIMGVAILCWWKRVADGWRTASLVALVLAQLLSRK